MRSLERNESHNRRSFYLIRTRHNRRFGNSTVRHQRALDFRCSESVATYIDNIVDTAHYPEIAVFVAPRAVTREVNALDLRPVLLFVALVVTPNRSEHRRPRTFNHEVATLSCRLRLSVSGHDVGVDAGERLCRGPGFGWRGTGNRSDRDCARLGLP